MRTPRNVDRSDATTGYDAHPGAVLLVGRAAEGMFANVTCHGHDDDLHVAEGVGETRASPAGMAAYFSVREIACALVEND